ncbi:MAG: alpha/beta hydrolase [Boseongicola sp.]|nr:alpha/beta hydrolase [Boseongicola sp.]
MGERLAAQALRRQARFESQEELADVYRHSRAFERLRPGVAELLARATLRSVADGSGFELCCPPAYEAQMLAHMYDWAIATNLETLRCPVKVIGGDPLAPFSFLPTVDPDLIFKVGYDFVPDTTHFLQLEEPEECARLLVEFLASPQAAQAC